jgi:excisionase family DNA binding protein
MASETDLAYCAGVVDSDGYIGVKRSDYAMRVRGDATQASYAARMMVKQVTPQAVSLLHEMFGGALMKASASLVKGKPLITWEVHSASAGVACRALLPYLRIKREQALNAIAVCDINSEPRRRTWTLPAVVDGEPMVTMAEAARRLGKDYGTVHQAVKLGSVPHVRTGPRQVLIPESYLDVWANRRRSPVRNEEITRRLHECFLRAKELNQVGTQQFPDRMLDADHAPGCPCRLCPPR